MDDRNGVFDNLLMSKKWAIGALYRGKLGKVTFLYDTKKAKVKHMQYKCTYLCTHLRIVTHFCIITITVYIYYFLPLLSPSSMLQTIYISNAMGQSL